jgi:hypothetical protein
VLKRMFILATAVVLTLGSVAHAKEAMVDTKKGYGLAGCGLGSMLFGAKPGGIQIIAATTNGLYGNQTFGITLGTLNCEITHMGMNAAIYIESNREVVLKEAARGEGETLAGLAQVLNCKDQNSFNAEMKNNFESIFVESDNAYTNVKRIYETINNSDLKKTCDLQS